MARAQIPSSPHDHVNLVPRTESLPALAEASRVQAAAIFMLRTDTQDLRSDVGDMRDVMTEFKRAFEQETLLNIAERAEAAKARAREAHWKSIWTFFAPVVYAIAGGVMLELVKRTVLH